MWDNTNATSSWSWYNHQWFVGIFVALYETLKIYNWKAWRSNEDVEEDLKKYKIVFENAEDFDIKYENTVRSRHQVKAYKWWNKKANYKKAIWKFNFTNLTEDVLCYFHVVCNVDDWDTYTGFKNEQQKLNSERIQLYEYPSFENDNSEIKQKFCPLDETIHTKSQKIISKIREGLYGRSSSENNLYKLYDLLNEQIYLKHKNGWYPEISFEKILETIKEDLNFKDIYIMKLKYNLMKKYESYCWQIINERSLLQYQKEKICKFLEIFQKSIVLQSNNQIKIKLQSWCIHKNDISDFSSDAFHWVVLKFCKYFFLKNLSEGDYKQVELYLLQKHNMKFTTIIEDEDDFYIVSQWIKDNKINFINEYFLWVNFITKNINQDMIDDSFLELNEEAQTNFSQENIDENRDNINKPIKFTFISIDTALWRI